MNSKERRKRTKKSLKKKKSASKSRKKSSSSSEKEALDSKGTKKITTENIYEFTTIRTIKVFYVNYKNTTRSIDFPVKIGNSFKDFLREFALTYSIDKDNAEIIFRNKKVQDLSSKYFSPESYNFDVDFILFIEMQTDQTSSGSFSSTCDYENLQKGAYNHLVMVSRPVQVNLIGLPTQFSALSLEVYQLPILDLPYWSKSKSLVYFEDLFLGDWKKRAELIYCTKTGPVSKDYSDPKQFKVDFPLKPSKIYILSFNVEAGRYKIFKKKKKYNEDDVFFVIPENKIMIIKSIEAKNHSDLSI